MLQLSFRRIRFSKEADVWLKVLKSRTGVTPNLLCRVAVCLSLGEEGDPTRDVYPEDSEREISRSTIFGNYEILFATLLRQRMSRDGVAENGSMDQYFRSHLHRGIRILQGRAKTLTQLAELVGESLDEDEKKKKGLPRRAPARTARRR